MPDRNNVIYYVCVDESGRMVGANMLTKQKAQRTLEEAAELFNSRKVKEAR